MQVGLVELDVVVESLRHVGHVRLVQLEHSGRLSGGGGRWGQCVVVAR